MTFARTKIQPPRPRSAYVERALVQARLADALLNRRVILLCAPAGYGKTTALAHEIARLPPEHAVAWISADAGDDLQRLLECMLAALEHEEQIEVWGLAAETRVRLARALLRQRKASDAAAVLRPVFARAQSDGGPAGALLATEALKELAAEEWGDALSARERDELQRWWQMLATSRGDAGPAKDAQARGATVPVNSPDPKLDPGLSPRELEVLGRIAAGDSNKLIARAFDLSLHTVKRHVAHILDKLDLDSRGQAAAWYRSHFATGSDSASR